MGEWKTFLCPKCNYKALVSGGYDFGRFGETVTIHCKTCKEVLDASLNRKEAFNDDWDKVRALQKSDGMFSFFKCPHSKTEKHDIEPWGTASKVKGGDWTCPKCGGKMKNTGLTMLWD